MAGGMVRATAQFLAGFIPAARVAKLAQATTKVAKVARAAGAGSAADFAVFSGQEGRLADLWREFQLPENLLTEFLASQPGDTEFEGRVKNAIEGLGLGILAEGLFLGVKAVRAGIIAKRPLRQAQGEGDLMLSLSKHEPGITERDFLMLGEAEKPRVVVTDEIAAAGDEFLSLADESIPGKAANINLARIDSPADVRETIADVAELFKDEIATATRGVQSHELTAQLADDLGMTPAQLLKRRAGEAFNAEEALAARRLLVSSADQLTALARAANGPNASDIDLFAFRRALSVHTAIQQEVSGLTAEAGRALNAFKIPAGGRAENLRAVREALEASGGPDFHRRMAAMLAALADEGRPGEFNKFARQAADTRTADVLLEYWINSLLAGPQTHAVNVLSNGLFALWQIPERALAARIGRLTGDEGVQAGEATALMFGMVKGFRDGLRLAGRAFVTGEPSDTFSKIEVRNSRAISAENLEMSGTLGRAVDFLGEAIRIPGRALIAADEFYKAVGYRAELQARALRMARQEGLGRGGDVARRAMATRIEEILRDPPEDIRLAAIDAARYSTFTKPLGDRGRDFQRFVSRNPAMRVILPFLRTPTNLIKVAGARMPLAPLSASIRADVAAGGARRDLALARITMGSMAMATVADLTMSGAITGGGPSETRARNTLRRTGWQPYSIRIGDTFYAYNRLDPLGMMIGIAADMTEIMGELGEQDRKSLPAAVVLAMAKNLTSKTYLTGISNVVLAIDDPDRYGEAYLRRQLATVVPFSSFLAQTERTGIPGLIDADPTLREARIGRAEDPDLKFVAEFLNTIRSRTPGFSDELPPRRNLWGRPIVLGGGLGPDIVSPIYTSTYDPEPIDEEILRLGVNVTMPPRRIGGIDLSAEEYDRFVALAGNELKDPNTGLGLLDTLNAVIGGKHDMSDEYRAASDGEGGGKSLIIRRLIIGFRDEARGEVIEEFPQLFALMSERRADAARALTGEGNGTAKP